VFAVVLWETKCLLERVQEVGVEEIPVEILLNDVWQLIVVLPVIVCAECLILVEVPLVVEMLLDCLLQLHVRGLVVVELLYCAEELGQLFSIIQTLVEGLNTLKDLDEVGHDH
jgi:hypothetical protein